MLPMAHKIKAICTEGDTISPAHSLKLFFDLAKLKSTSLYILSGNSHSPVKDCHVEFLIAFRHIIGQLLIETDQKSSSMSMEHHVFDRYVKLFGWSLFDREVIRRNIHKLYQSMRSEMRIGKFSKYFFLHGECFDEIEDENCFEALMCDYDI